MSTISAYPTPRGRRSRSMRFCNGASTDALVVLHNGRIVIERYANDMGPRTPHILMSVSKSLLGLLTGILVSQGKIDPDEPRFLCREDRNLAAAEVGQCGDW